MGLNGPAHDFSFSFFSTSKVPNKYQMHSNLKNFNTIRLYKSWTIFWWFLLIFSFFLNSNSNLNFSTGIPCLTAHRRTWTGAQGTPVDWAGVHVPRAFAGLGLFNQQVRSSIDPSLVVHSWPQAAETRWARMPAAGIFMCPEAKIWPLFGSVDFKTTFVHLYISCVENFFIFNHF
jgi:hypothetical protein